MKKFILISPKNRTAYNFRGDLIKEIMSRGYEVIVTGPNRDNVDKIEALGAKFVEIPMNKNGLNPLNDLKYQKALYELFAAEKPDVTLGYTSKPVIYGSIAAKKAGVPFAAAMVTGAGFAFAEKSAKAKLVKTVISMLYRKAFRKADVAIFQNIDDKKEFVSSGIVSENKAVVIDGSGVNTEKFAVSPYPETLTFFMLSRFLYYKGIREYLEACRAVKAEHPEVRFMLLGACEDSDNTLKQSELEPYVRDGIIEHYGETDNVAEFYRKCSVFVLPSYYREGIPRTIQEAMATGRAVITTDSTGCRETVIDGKTGFLVPVRNADAIKEKMLEFVNNPSLVESMGKASAEYCAQKFDVRKINREMCELMHI